MVDWTSVETWALCGLAFWSVGAVVMVIAFRNLFYEFMSHPGVQAIIRTAAKFSGKKGGFWEGVMKKFIGDLAPEG